MAGTGNPVPSDQIADLKVNAETLDQFVSSTGVSATTRTGKEIKTIHAIEQEADTLLSTKESELDNAIQSTGWFVVGNFADGFTYTAYNQVGTDVNGNQWSYTGPLPFTVAAGTTPSEPNYTNRGDAAVRSDAANGSLQLANYTAKEISDAISEQDQKAAYSVIERVSDMLNVSNLYVKYDSGTGTLTIAVVHNTESVTNYVTAYNLVLKDELRLLESIDIYQSDGSPTFTRNLFETDLTGNWQTVGSPALWYAQDEGDTFTYTLPECTDIAFRSYQDDRGGLFRFDVISSSNEIVVSKTLSTYASLASNTTFQLAQDLEEDTYTVRAVFLGDDPFAVPSSGVGNSRGWIRGGSTASFNLKNSMDALVSNGNSATVMDSSIQEFAIRARDSSLSYYPDWTPFHGNVGSTRDVSYKVSIVKDGSIMPAITNVNEIPSSWIKADSVSYEQFYNAKQTADPDPNKTIWKGYLQHKFDKSGKMTTNHKLTFSIDVDISIAYLFMMAGKTANVPEIRFLNRDNEVKTAIAPASTESVNKGITYGGLRFGTDLAAGRPLVYASEPKSIVRSFSLDKSYSHNPTADGTLFTDRPDGTSKLYHIAADGGQSVSAGTIWSISTETIAGAAVNPMLAESNGVGFV